jgi:hypothetical protein
VRSWPTDYCSFLFSTFPSRLRHQLRLDLLDRRQTPFQALRQFPNQCRLPPGDADRLFQITERILDDDRVLRPTEQQSDRRLVVGVTQQIIYSREIHVELSDEPRLERHGLQLDDHVATELQVIKE